MRTRITLLGLCVLAAGGCGSGDDGGDAAGAGGGSGAASGGAAGSAGGVDGTAGEAGGGASAGGSGGTAGAAAETCRRIPSSGDMVVDFGTPETTTFTLDFDAAAKELAFTIDSSTGPLVVVNRYVSPEEFVAERASTGLVLYTERELVGDQLWSNTFDGQGRLSGWTKTGGESAVYTEWDAEGRPVAGAWAIDSADCSDAAITIVYDDVARTSEQLIDFPSGTGADCPSEAHLDRVTFDPENIDVKREEGTPGALVLKFEVTDVGGHQSVCVN